MKLDRSARHRATFLKNVSQRVSDLSAATDLDIRNAIENLGEKASARKPDQAAIKEEVLALSKEAIRRVLGINLYDVQQLASKVLMDGNVAEMATGEGKTVSAVPAAVYGAVTGMGTHVATPSSYLATRDFQELQPVFEFLGLSSGLLDTESNTQEKRNVYGMDIVYGPGFEFGFDYLRDQLEKKSQESLPAGRNFLNRLAGKDQNQISQIRGLGMSIVDEIDNVLIDDASSPQVLSEFQSGVAPDSDAVVAARLVASQLVDTVDFREMGPERIELTEHGNETIYSTGVEIPARQLKRPWSEYVEAALRARFLFHKNVHYVVNEQEVRIVEQSTGRIFEDRSWQAGLHQAVEAKEGVEISPESVPLARITRQRFYQLYKKLGGMTGTAGECRREFKSVYDLSIEKIPLRTASQRIKLPHQTFVRQEEKWQAILDSTLEFHRAGRPILIGTRTIRESQILQSLFEESALRFQLLNGTQDADEAELVAQAGQPNAITIATNLAGRGTDIKLDPKVREAGGLHVIVAESHESSRVDRQLVGRCARQDDPGSCQTFISAEDWLLVTHAPWLSEAIQKMAGSGNLAIDIYPKIKRLQRKIERQRFAGRWQLFNEAKQMEKLLSSQ